jgi:hypothetical protein
MVVVYITMASPIGMKFVKRHPAGWFDAAIMNKEWKKHLWRWFCSAAGWIAA